MCGWKKTPTDGLGFSLDLKSEVVGIDSMETAEERAKRVRKTVVEESLLKSECLRKEEAVGDSD